MSEWEGNSKGSLLGYKIFVFSIRNLGLRFSYTLLLFVAFYYCLTSWKSNKSIFTYLRKHQQFSFFKSLIGVYRSYYVFGQTLIDRIMISSGNRERFTYEFDGIENIKKKLRENKGAILISAHVGNFEISEYFLEDVNDNLVTNIVTTQSEQENIKNYLDQFSLKSRMKYILIKNDMSHIFEMKEALDKNEFICITGDRYLSGQKLLKAKVLGEEAYFPAGPFLIGAKLNVPVLFVYVMKETATHYHLYAREAKFTHRNTEELLESYVVSFTEILKKYPYQWFNYFDFWGKPESLK